MCQKAELKTIINTEKYLRYRNEFILLNNITDITGGFVKTYN